MLRTKYRFIKFDDNVMLKNKQLPFDKTFHIRVICHFLISIIILHYVSSLLFYYTFNISFFVTLVLLMLPLRQY